jgi:hypothetical protein
MKTKGVHTAVVLPAEVLEELRQSERGVSEEIRAHVSWRLNLNPVDNATLELLRDVARMAADVERETGAAWHTHAGSHATFRQALLSRLARLKPEGPMAFGERPHRADPNDDPEEVGVWIEHGVWETRDWSRKGREQLRLAKERSLRELYEMNPAFRKQEGSND